MKVIVIGLDGMHWDVIEKFDLPNIRRMVKEGVKGYLESCIPFVTFPAWKCYSTGKNPGKLGVYWWLGIDFRRERLIPHNSMSFRSKDFWDYLSISGKKVGIFNMPGTYPPKAVNGFQISGPFALVDKGFSKPKHLEVELKKRGYRHVFERSPEKHRKEFHEWLKDMIEIRFDFLEERIGEIDFQHLTIFYIDDVLHYFWISETTREFMEQIDKRIGELLEKNVNVFLMSDHGMGELRGLFYVNEWLRKKGYLSESYDLRERIKLAIHRNNLDGFLNRTGILGFAERIMQKKKREVVLSQDEGMRVQGFNRRVISCSWMHSIARINWKKTIALATSEGPIYINPFISGARKRTLIEKLKSEFLELKHPTTGENVIERVFEASEIYTGPYVNQAPDLILYQNDGYEITDALHANHRVYDDAQNPSYMQGARWIANHRRIGVFAAFGPDIRKNRVLKNVKIYDLAPTILHMFELPVPNDMDGRVLKEIFRFKSKPAIREVEYCDPEEFEIEKDYEINQAEEEKIKEKLKALGYLG